MPTIRTTREFRWWAPGKCVFCKLALWVFKGNRTYENVSDEAATAAVEAGAAVRVEDPK